MPSYAARNVAGCVRDVVPTALAYSVCVASMLQLTRFGGGVAIVWSAGAVLFAKLAASPRRRWRAITLGTLAAGLPAGLLFGLGQGAWMPLACLSAGEAFAAAWILKRLCPRFGRFQSTGEAARFLAVAGVIVPAASASIAAGCVRTASGLSYWAAWYDWYAGHALGLVVFAPPLLLVFGGEVGRWIRLTRFRRMGEIVGLLGAVVLACAVTFGQNRLPLVVLPFVPMIAATFRLERFGAVASTLILMTTGLACSLAGMGPTTLLRCDMAMKLQLLQLYFATAVLILLPIAAELRARRLLLERLRAAEALHRLILDRTGDVILRLGADGTVRYASSSVVRMWGYAPEELVGRAAFAAVHRDDAAMLAEARGRAIADPDATEVTEYRVHRKDGSSVWVESHMRATLADDGRVTGTVSILREITERRRMVEDLARRATTDPLTGLANRRAFDEALVARLAAGGGGCVAMFDLDHFKRVNDAHGHAMGDAVLVRFAAVLRASVRDGDLVARLGGEEFAVLLGGATVEQARRVCNRIRVRLASGTETSTAGETVRVTVSVGIAAMAGAPTADGVIAAADAALYRAKEAGRNRLALAA